MEMKANAKNKRKQKGSERNRNRKRPDKLSEKCQHGLKLVKRVTHPT